MHHSQKAACMGSSPRVRGSLLPRRFAAASTGIIPAGAGLTTPSKVNPLAFRDHPRGCGAHRLIHDYFSSSEGSSPRVRGSQVGRQRFDLRTGIIPAGAGLTRQSGLQLRTRRDHPRGCGAHDFFIDATRDITGSSPRVRGSQRLVKAGHILDGIIPAGAGLTPSSPRARRNARDHPRGCGAHSASSPCISFLPGSSPRVRGSQNYGR